MITSYSAMGTPLDTDDRRAVINWFMLRGFGQSYAGTASLAAPFIGYAIIYHDAVRDWVGGLGGFLDAAAGTCAPWIGFEARLHFLYFGALAFGLGTLIFRLSAHHVIKRFKDIDDYVASQYPTMTARNARSFFVTIRSRRKSLEKQFLASAPWLDRKVPLKEAEAEYEKPEAEQVVKNVLRSFYTVHERYSKRRRVWATFALYALGGVLLFLPSLDFMRRVICTVFAD